MSFIYDLTDIWNDSGTTFTGIKLNVTDTASASGSLLMDLQVGGVSRMHIAKTGQVVASNLTIPSITSPTTEISNGKIKLSFASPLQWTPTHAQATPDLSLYRDAANTLAQRNGVNAQTLRLYNTYTDASNYERMKFGWSSNVFEIKPENAGTGSARVVHISGLPTSNPGPGILWNNAGTPAIGT